MPVLPVPMIIALLLFGLLLHKVATQKTHITLLGLISICATQAAVIALVQYYGVAALRPAQALIATCIPAIAWFAFAHAAGQTPTAKNLTPHIAGPIVGAVALLLNPTLLDALIPLLFAGYGLAMLLRLSRGEDSLPHSRLESGNTPVLAWRVVGLSLLASAACDVAISYQMASGTHLFLLWLPSIVSSLSLLSLGALSLSNATESHREDDAAPAMPSEEEEARDKAIMTTLDAYVQQHKPFLDADLTLTRLSRKLVVPAKQLSTAINRARGENVSRFINRLRIEHACQLLRSGASVTHAMLESGFNTKSNFNREFLRVHGQSPRDWLNSNTH
jgi:AraC-like DNA-binding protein